MFENKRDRNLRFETGGLAGKNVTLQVCCDASRGGGTRRRWEEIRAYLILAGRWILDRRVCARARGKEGENKNNTALSKVQRAEKRRRCLTFAAAAGVNCNAE